MNARLLFVHALSPLHAGTGQGTGVIDLPIAREKATGLPFLPGSSLKGPLRERCSDTNLQHKVFGPDTTNASDHAGSAQFTDLRLLLLPVRSLAGTFAWVTSPLVLQRLARDAQDALGSEVPTAIPRPASLDQCVVIERRCALSMQFNAQRTSVVVLEDLDLNPVTDASATQWAQWIGMRVFAQAPDWQAALDARFCVVHDDVLSFLLETATEITARVKLQEETKTVKKGGLWYEEALPAETILAGLVVATPVRKTNVTPDEIWKALADLTATAVQLGGKATVGRGLCRVRVA